MTKLCFIDTETTSLRHDRRAWEIGLIVREPGQEDREHQWFVHDMDLDLGNADVMSLNIGRFYQRHPQHAPDGAPNYGTNIYSEHHALTEVERVTRGAHLVGAVVSFDADVLGQRMRANGICPSWHYHLIDVEGLAVGYLSGSPAFGQSPSGIARLDAAELISPPWKSDDLSAALGIKVSDEDRHTALGDAKWARAIYDAVTGGVS